MPVGRWDDCLDLPFDNFCGRVRGISPPAFNTAFQHIEVLRRNRTKRHRHREFVVEGVRALNAAIAGGWPIRSFAFARGRTLSRWATDVLEASTPDLDDVVRLSDRYGREGTSAP